MGFLINNYTLLGIPLQNVYISIKGRYCVQNNTFIYGMSKKYQIYADYWFSVGKGQPTVKCDCIIINTDELPANIYNTVFDNIKSALDVHYGTDQQTLQFTDDI
jgi:hypothetical protein